MNSIVEDGERQTVLLIDDDPMITELFGEILGDLFDVRICNNIGAAMQAIKHDAIAVVVSDYHIGSGDAEILFAWLCKNKPELARGFVLLTGDKVADLSVFKHVAAVLYKPVHIATLIETVVQLVQSRKEHMK